METLRAQQSALADDLVAIQRQLDDIRSAAESPDGLITATVDGRGRVIDLDLNARIYRTTDSRGLAEQILAAIERASEHAAGLRRMGQIITRGSVDD